MRIDLEEDDEAVWTPVGPGGDLGPAGCYSSARISYGFPSPAVASLKRSRDDVPSSVGAGSRLQLRIRGVGAADRVSL